MMWRWLLAILWVCGCGESKPLDPLDPDSFPRFSGTVTVEAGGRTNVYEYDRDGNKLRIVPQVSTTATADQRMAIIVDQEAGTSTAISWGRRQYYVQPLSGLSGRPAPIQWPLGERKERSRIESRKSLEPEIVDGHTCAVEAVTMRSSAQAAYNLKVWSASDLRGFPMRIETADGPAPITVTFRNVALDPVRDPAIFQVPEGFTNAASGT